MPLQHMWITLDIVPKVKEEVEKVLDSPWEWECKLMEGGFSKLSGNLLQIWAIYWGICPTYPRGGTVHKPCALEKRRNTQSETCSIKNLVWNILFVLDLDPLLHVKMYVKFHTVDCNKSSNQETNRHSVFVQGCYVSWVLSFFWEREGPIALMCWFVSFIHSALVGRKMPFCYNALYKFW